MSTENTATVAAPIVPQGRPPLDLSPQQLRALNAIQAWWNTGSPGKPVFELCGYAGTGKTTCIRAFIDQLGLAVGEDVLFAAYTGKAASVMKRYGNLPASTIHSLIYKPIGPNEVQIKAVQEQLDKSTDNDERRRLRATLRELNQPSFEINEESKLASAALIVLDECSMVGKELLRDVLHFGVPVVAIGDPGQLDPIGDEPALFRGEPDVMLTEIHRQAEGNPIINMSMLARQGRPIPYAYNPLPETDKALHMKRTQLPSSDFGRLMAGCDQVICGKHRTRMQLNRQLRMAYGFNSPYPMIGDKVVCMRNDKKTGLLNGVMGKVVSDAELFDLHVEFAVKMEDQQPDDKPLEIQACRYYFDLYIDPKAEENYPERVKNAYQHFDFGYVITVHKAQGSQWDRVFVEDDGMFKGWGEPGARQKWLYTAVTRAAESLIIRS